MPSGRKILVPSATQSLPFTHLATTNNPQLFADNMPSGGNLLTAADITWINNACAQVPEPSTMVLVLGAIVTLGMARRRVA